MAERTQQADCGESDSAAAFPAYQENGYTRHRVHQPEEIAQLFIFQILTIPKAWKEEKKSSLYVKSDCICFFVLCDNKYVYCEMNSLLLTFTTFYKMALRALKLCVSYEGENLLGQF